MTSACIYVVSKTVIFINLLKFSCMLGTFWATNFLDSGTLFTLAIANFKYLSVNIHITNKFNQGCLKL